MLAEAAASVLELVGSPEVGREWTQPSALEGMTVGGLAAHFVTALRMTVILLEQERPDTDRVASPFEFFGDNRRVGRGSRRRTQPADRGHVRGRCRRRSGRGRRGADERDRPGRRHPRRSNQRATPWPPAGCPMRCAACDDYLLTRIAEVVLHGDDLAASVGVTWHPPVRAATATIGLLVGPDPRTGRRPGGAAGPRPRGALRPRCAPGAVATGRAGGSEVLDAGGVDLDLDPVARPPAHPGRGRDRGVQERTLDLRLTLSITAHGDDRVITTEQHRDDLGGTSIPGDA